MQAPKKKKCKCDRWRHGLISILIHHVHTVFVYVCPLGSPGFFSSSFLSFFFPMPMTWLDISRCPRVWPVDVALWLTGILSRYIPSIPRIGSAAVAPLTWSKRLLKIEWINGHFSTETLFQESQEPAISLAKWKNNGVFLLNKCQISNLLYRDDEGRGE